MTVLRIIAGRNCGVWFMLWDVTKGVAGSLATRLRHLFDRCLAWGECSDLWREGRMVLLPKTGRPPDLPSAFRPVCLLEEAGKLLERIVAARLEAHLSRGAFRLQEDQYSFRRGRSTIDAIVRVRTFVEKAVRQGRMALTVSLDIFVFFCIFHCIFN
jgi:hypothetical protein